MDRRIKFRHLDAFSAIARSASLKKAAEILHLTQPALSRSLKELEDIVGARLMKRSRSGVVLTHEGEVFLQFAEQSTAALRHGLRSIRASGEHAGTLKIGALPSVAAYLLPKAVTAFAQQGRDMLIEVHEGTHYALLGMLRSGRLDLVAGRLGRPESMEGLSFRQLYTEEVVIVARPDSRLTFVSTFEELTQYRVIYPPAQSAIRSLVARLFISHGMPLFENRIESASPVFGRAVTLADPQTCWFISRSVVAQDLKEGRLASLDLDTSMTRGAVGIMSRAEEIASPAVRAFAQQLASTVEKEETC